jgi:hypothetical protein
MFVLRLVPTPSAPDPIRSLRGALKILLRRYQLRCLSVEEIAASAPNHQKEA